MREDLRGHTSFSLQPRTEKRFMESIIHKRFNARIMNTAIYTANSGDEKGVEERPK